MITFKRMLLLLAVLIFFAAVPALAQVSPSPWYAVVYAPETDTLQWIKAGCEQGEIARPRLLDEADLIDLRIAPNGQKMVMASRLNSGLEALGIYDFAAGTFLATHLAQPGETINLGGEQIFTANSAYAAVGFSSGDFTSPAWRVILFELATGNLAAFIDHTHPDAPEVPLSAPAVQMIDGTYVHFQLIPQSVIGGTAFPAYAWRISGFSPGEPTILESPYSSAQAQVQLMTGQTVAAYNDPAFPAAPAGLAPASNAIGIGTLIDGSAFTPIYADGAAILSAARWARNGEWAMFRSENPDGSARRWNIALTNGSPGTNSVVPFHQDFSEAFGTTDGYLLTTTNDLLYFSTSFAGETMVNIAQLTPNSRIVYVTPIGANFTLSPIPNTAAAPVVQPPAVQTVAPVQPPPPANTCASALATRVFVGGMGRVIAATLNVRAQPGGTILTSYGTGTTFFVTGGSACTQDLIWWQIERFGTVGWVAESVNGDYLIEPYNGPMSPDPTDVPLQPPGIPEGVPSACQNALPHRLVIGGVATVMASSLQPHNGPGGEVVGRGRYMSGTVVTINAGPECAGDQWWWLVTGDAKIGHIGNNIQQVQGWVAETATGAYNLGP